MNIPPVRIRCDSCGYFFRTMQLEGPRCYRLDSGDTFPLVSRVGWCGQDAAFAAIEAPVRIKRLQWLLRMMREDLQQRKNAEGFDAPAVRSREEQIHSCEIRIGIFSGRRSLPHCLHCGCEEVIPVELVQPLGGETLRLDLRHPGCGGRFLVQADCWSPVVVTHKQTAFYDPEGHRL